MKKLFGGKLNKSGLTLIEVFFSFVVIIIISVTVVNAFSQKVDTSLIVKSYEEDHFESLKAVSKALMFTAVDDKYEIFLDNYIPLVHLDGRNELHLINIYQETIDGGSFKDFNRKYELFHRYKMGEALLTTERFPLTDEYKVNIRMQTNTHNQFQMRNIPQMIIAERGVTPGIGVYFTIKPHLFVKRYEDLKLNNILVPSPTGSSEVLTYEQTF